MSTPTFIHGKGTMILANGKNISEYLNKIDAPRPLTTPETTTFGKEDKCYIPGLGDGTISMDGFYDGTSGAVDEFFSGIFGLSGSNFCWYYNTDAAGERGYGASMINSAYSVMSTKDDAVKISAAAQSSVGRENIKSLVTSISNFIDDGVTTTAPIDLLAAGNSGGAGYLQMLTINSGTVSSIKIQHATTAGGSYSDIVTFTHFTGTGMSERIAIAAGTNSIKQYVKVSIDGTNYDINFNVAISKNLI